MLQARRSIETAPQHLSSSHVSVALYLRSRGSSRFFLTAIFRRSRSSRERRVRCDQTLSRGRDSYFRTCKKEWIGYLVNNRAIRRRTVNRAHRTNHNAPMGMKSGECSCGREWPEHCNAKGVFGQTEVGSRVCGSASIINTCVRE